jgi:hydroxymethylglutaryl-CoA lyase
LRHVHRTGSGVTAMSKVSIVEVAARDGLQNDPADLSTEQKIELIRRTVEAGITRAEIASFVNPKRVPKMADAEAVVEGLAALPIRNRFSGIGLVLNARGFERAAQTRVDEVNVVVVSSETFSQRNQGMATLDGVAVLAEVVPLAQAAGITPTVTLAASFGCPFEGEVPIERTRMLVERCAETGVEEIALADTIGVAVPADVTRRVAAAAELAPGVRLRAHFHNTRNTGYANAIAAADAGVTQLDASLAGIGGCPFAPKATGNIATEDLAYLLERSGYDTGLDLDALIEASEWLEGVLGHRTATLVTKAGLFPPRNAA